MKLRSFILTCSLIHCFLLLHSQPAVLHGKVTNENYESVSGATVILKSKDGRFISFRLSDTNGEFSMNIQMLAADAYILEIRHVSFLDVQRTILIPLKNHDEAIQFSLKARSVELKEVILHREPPLVMKSDTLQFNAGSFKNAETRKLEDLLKNINGFIVDASGKISFNGKPVEKVLIEGDDLVDKGYRMITKNLNADIIEKIEVIDNYNDNRLMRNISKSGTVGINLKMAPNIKNRLSGSVAVGLSMEKKYLAEGNLTYISNAAKFISFANANNIAEDVYGNVRYYYVAEEEDDNKSTTEGQPYDILSAGSVVPPAIGEKYRNHNDDAGTALMGSWKLGEFTKMKTIIGFDRLSFVRTGFVQHNTYINNLEQWSTINRLLEKVNMQDILSSFSLHRDTRQNHISQIRLDLGTVKDKNSFNNLSFGSLVDTLSEVLTGNKRFILFRWDESFRLRDKVFTMGLIFKGQHQIQLLNNESGRFTELYGIDSTYKMTDQWLEKKYSSGELFTEINVRKRKWQYQLGIRMSGQFSDFEASTRFTDKVYPHNVFDTGYQRVTPMLGESLIYINAGRKIKKAGFLSIKTYSGVAALHQYNMSFVYPVIKMELAYSHAISPLKSVYGKINFNNNFNGYHLLYPRGLISGDGTILDGATFSGPARSLGWMAGYHASNVYRHSQWGVGISYATINHQYNQVMNTNPSYTIVSYCRFQPNAILLCSLNGEKFISLIKSRLGASYLYSRFILTYAVNDDTGSSFRSSSTVEGRWSTGFTNPVNLETKARIIRAAGRWEQQLPNVSHQFQLNVKIKVTTSKKGYAALAWNFYRLSASSEFHGLDAFINYGFSKVLKFSLKCSNLLNGSVIRDKKVSDFSNTLSDYNLVGRYLMIQAELQL